MPARTLLIVNLIVSLSVWLGSPNSASADSIVRPHSAIRTHSDRFSVGRSIVSPQTPQLTLEQLAARTAGQVSTNAVQRYGTFPVYWQVSRSSRSGMMLEALLAFQDNRHWAAVGSSERLLVTAAEGYPHHLADLTRLGADGSIVRQYQAKLGWRAAIGALNDPKYAEMSIVTTQDSLAIIERKLLRHEQSALRRGISLPEYWANVRRGLDDGRLLRTTPSGLTLPTQDGVVAAARASAERSWEMQAGQKVGTLARIGKVAGVVFVVADTAGTAYFTYQDFGRYQAGEIAGSYLGLKTGLRGTQLGLTYYALMTPEPTTKLLATAAVVAIVVVDAGIEWVHETISGSEMRATQKILQDIDRDERHHAVRRLLLNESENERYTK